MSRVKWWRNSQWEWLLQAEPHRKYVAAVTEEIPGKSYTILLHPYWEDREQAYASLAEAQAAAEAILTLEGIL